MRVYNILALILILYTADAVRSRPNSGYGNTAAAAADCADKGCSHDCETEGKLPVCVCPQDMLLDSDGKTCRDSTSFLLAMFRGIRLYSEGSEDETTVAPVKARCLDYHYGRKELYAYTNYTIMRYPLSKGKTASPSHTWQVAHTDTAITSMAVDWVNDVIYHISEQQLVLGVTSLVGEDRRTVLSHNDSSTAGWRSLAVDPYAKKLFWVGSKDVYSASLEGKDVTTGLISWLEPDQIALDTTNQLIYAIGRQGEKSNKYITRATYTGTKVGKDIEVSQPATVEIFGFGVVGETAYWESNHDGENIYKCNINEVDKSGKAKATLAVGLNQIVYDMKVFNKEIQKPPK